jgi:hypothetical protein
MLEDQQKTLKDLEAGKKVNKKLDDDDIDMKFLNGEDDDDDDDGPDIADLLPAKAQPKTQVKEVKEEAKVVRASVKPEPKKEVPPAAKSSELDSIFSLKAIDDYLSQYEKDPEKFMKYFERKQAIFNMMQKG